MDIPFTTYFGGLKQINTDFHLPMMKALFNTTFGHFEGLHVVAQELEKQRVRYVVTAAGAQLVTGMRQRRFAGGSNLPSGRYYSICSPEDFNDFGSLRDEMYAYYSRGSGIVPLILDPKVDLWLTDSLVNNGFFTRGEMQYPYFAILYRFVKETEANKSLDPAFLQRTPGHTSLVTYGINQLITQVDNVIDLRLPETQEWFTKTFVELELENEIAASKRFEGVFLASKPRLKDFGQLLPVISSLEIGGGNIFGQAVGAWLRTHGAGGLIFPSARSTCENVVKNGKVVSSKGWNMVLYDGAPPPEETELFGQMTTWIDPDHDHIRVKYETSGEGKGSFSMRGVKEWNLLKFDQEKFYCYNKSEFNVVSDFTGVFYANITKRTKQYLDQQSQHGALWYNDVDTTDFLNFYEKSWISKV